jgi:hypothetical protein
MVDIGLLPHKSPSIPSKEGFVAGDLSVKPRLIPITYGISLDEMKEIS